MSKAGSALDWQHLPPDLAPIDRVMQRWAVSQGTGLPTDLYDDTPHSKPPPLDDDTLYRVDRLVVRASEPHRRFLRYWYCSPIPERQIARLLGVDRTDLQLFWRGLLGWLKGQFAAERIAVVDVG